MKAQETSLEKWVGNKFPILTAFIAIAVLILSPLWAYRWYNLPFIGAFLEPNNVVGEDWPAKDMGVETFDYLIEANGEPSGDPQTFQNLLAANGYQPITLTFGQQEGDPYSVTLTPRHLRIDELATYFMVPYFIGLAFFLTGVWAYRTDPGRRSARAFLVFTSAASIAITALLDTNTTQFFALGWSLSLPILAAALFHLALVFPRPMPFVRKYPSLRFLPWLPTLLLVYPNTKEILSPTTHWGYIDAWRWSYLYCSVAILFFFGMLMARIVRGRSAIARQQSRIIIFGAALGFGPLLLLFLSPLGWAPSLRFKSLI